MTNHITHETVYGPDHVSDVVTSRPYMAGGYRNVDKTWRCRACRATGEYTVRASA